MSDRKLSRLKVLFLLIISFIVAAISFPQSINAVSGFQRVSLNPTDDSQIDSDNTTTNYGSLPYLSTQALAGDHGYFGTGFGIDIDPEISAVLKFNISSIPPDSYINGAYLKLFAYHINTDAPCELVLSRFTGDWSERRITYSNSPSTVTLSQYRYTVRGKGYLRTGRDEAWQITDLVKKWISGEYKNYGIHILNESSQKSSLCKFYSKDETVQANQEKKPQLIVEYLPPLKILSTTVPVNQISDTVANLYWTTNIPVLSKVYYRKTSLGNWQIQSSNETITTNRVILQNLTPNTSYTVRVLVRDAADRERVSQDIQFTTKTLARTIITPPVFRRLDPTIPWFGGLYGSSPTPSPSQPAPNNPNTTQQNQNNEIKILSLRYEATQTGGTFWWTTKKEDGSDVKTSGFVYLSKDSEPTKSNHDFDFGKNQGEINHTVELKYLEPDTTYQYLVYSEDDDNLIGTFRGTFITNHEALGITPTAEVTNTTGYPDNNTGQDQTNDNTPNPTDNNAPSTDQTTYPAGNTNVTNPPNFSGQQNPAESLIAGFTDNTGKFSRTSIFIIILLVLIIILLIVLITKRNKTTSSDKDSDTHKNPAKAAKHVEVKTEENGEKNPASEKKGRNWLKIIIIVVIAYIALSFIISTLRFFLPIGFLPFI